MAFRSAIWPRFTSLVFMVIETNPAVFGRAGTWTPAAFISGGRGLEDEWRCGPQTVISTGMMLFRADSVAALYALVNDDVHAVLAQRGRRGCGWLHPAAIWLSDQAGDLFLSLPRMRALSTEVLPTVPTRRRVGARPTSSGTAPNAIQICMITQPGPVPKSG